VKVHVEAGVINYLFAALSGYIYLQKMCLSEHITHTYEIHVVYRGFIYYATIGAFVYCFFILKSNLVL